MATDQLTIYDLQSREDAKVDVRQLPRLARYGVRLTMAAGRREFVTSTVLQLVSGAALGLTLVVGQQALQALLEVEDAARGFPALVPWAGLLALVTGASMFISAVQREQQQILGELVSRYMQSRTLEVAARVDLLSFERPEFHNRMQRVQSSVQSTATATRSTGRTATPTRRAASSTRCTPTASRWSAWRSRSTRSPRCPTASCWRSAGSTPSPATGCRVPSASWRPCPHWARRTAPWPGPATAWPMPAGSVGRAWWMMSNG